MPASNSVAVPLTPFDAGRWAVAGPATAPAPGAAGGDGWLTCAADDLAAWLPHLPVPTPIFEAVPLAGFAAWLEREILRPPNDRRICLPRLELPTGESARSFLKQFDHDRFARWLTRQEDAAAQTGCTPARGMVMVACADYTRAALDLRRLLARHCPRKGPLAGRRRLALVLDFFGVDLQGNWQAATRLGVHYPVFLLARGIPGCPVATAPPASAAPLPPSLSADRLAQAEAIFHGAVGELGTERILFGSGAFLPADPPAAAAVAAAANWFAQPRPWLDAPSLALLFGGNARRLMSADPHSLDPAPLAADREPLEVVAEHPVDCLEPAVTDCENTDHLSDPEIEA